MKATLTFPSIQMAKHFASSWACKTLCGHDMSSVNGDGSVSVTVYDVTEEGKQWIDSYVNEIS